jgi:hypothetical protein
MRTTAASGPGETPETRDYDPARTLPRSGLLESGSQGCLAPGPHNTPHAGPHGAFPPDWKGHPSVAPPQLVTTQAAIAVSPGQVQYDP